LLVGGGFGLLDYRFDIVTRVSRPFVKLLRLEVPVTELSTRSQRDARGATVWAIVANLAALSHLAGDLVVSGSADYADWGVQVFWPLTDRAWVFPCVPWGDIGITLVFAAGAALMLRPPRRVQLFAALSLLGVVAYIAIRSRLG
jgi:hypothetical protein